MAQEVVLIGLREPELLCLDKSDVLQFRDVRSGRPFGNSKLSGEHALAGIADSATASELRHPGVAQFCAWREFTPAQ